MITTEQILKDAVFAACPQLSEEQVSELVRDRSKERKEVKIKNKIKLRQARDQNYLKQAQMVRDKFVIREMKRLGQSITLPDITTLRTYTQGNYTVVLLNGEFVGVSKRNKCDKFNHSTGINKALYRAVRRLVLTSQC